MPWKTLTHCIMLRGSNKTLKLKHFASVLLKPKLTKFEPKLAKLSSQIRIEGSSLYGLTVTAHFRFCPELLDPLKVTPADPG